MITSNKFSEETSAQKYWECADCFILRRKNVSYRTVLSHGLSLCQVIWPQSVLVSYQIFQANKQLFEWLILISHSAAKKSSASGQQRAEKKGKGQISQLEFSFVFTSKNFSALFGAWASQTCSPLPHVPHMCLRLVSHTCTSSILSGLGFWHELLPSVVCVVSEREPLSACWQCSSA